MKIRMVMIEGEGDAQALAQMTAAVLGRPTLLQSAVTHLRKCGHTVEPAPGVIPGLWLFDGAEITTGQLLHAADQIA